MQLIPRYLYNNRVTVITNDVGFITEYKPVYRNQVRITKGIDNVLQFKFLNADQKPVDIFGKQIIFVAYDEKSIKVLEETATVLDDGITTSTKGLTSVTIGKTSLENLPQQYLSYAVYIDDGSAGQTLTYANSHFDAGGTIYLDASVFPEPRGDVELRFTAVASVLIADDDRSDSVNYWATDPVSATPSGETYSYDNAIIVTPVIDSANLVIQYSQDKQITYGTNWIDITPTNITSDSTESTFEFSGTYEYIRVYITQDPETITTILLRN